VRGRWNDVARDVLLDRRTRQRGVLDPAGVDQLLRDHAAGRAEGGDRIWTLMNLELWYRTFVDGEGVQTLPEPATAAAHANSLAEIRPAAAAR
jgi:asparagine synthase (glutamine-hydrolysing)